MIKFKKSAHRCHIAAGTLHVGMPMLDMMSILPLVLSNIAREVVEFIDLQPATEDDLLISDSVCLLDIHPTIQFRNTATLDHTGYHEHLQYHPLGEKVMSFGHDLPRFGFVEDGPVKHVEVLVRDAQVSRLDGPPPFLLREMFITLHWG